MAHVLSIVALLLFLNEVSTTSELNQPIEACNALDASRDSSLLQVASSSSTAHVSPVGGYSVTDNPNKTQGTYAGWIRARTGNEAVIAMHIAKTGGMNFAHDLYRLLPTDIGLFSIEQSYDQLWWAVDNFHLVTMLRQPRTHVLSQYIECKSDPVWHPTPHAQDFLYANFSTWLNLFNGGHTIEDLRCYHPWNMQTRCIAGISAQRGPNKDCHQVPEEWSQFNDADWESARLLHLDHALQHMKNAYMVGLLERYQESICLLYGKLVQTGPMPLFCNCEDRQAWATFKNWQTPLANHLVSHHDISEVSAEDLERIDQLTQSDVLLYQAAEERFNHEIKLLEQEREMKINCTP